MKELPIPIDESSEYDSWLPCSQPIILVRKYDCFVYTNSLVMNQPDIPTHGQWWSDSSAFVIVGSYQYIEYRVVIRTILSALLSWWSSLWFLGSILRRSRVTLWWRNHLRSHSLKMTAHWMYWPLGRSFRKLCRIWQP